MCTDEMPRRLVHGVDVERAAVPQRGGGEKRIGNRPLEQGVDVQAGPGGASSVEGLACFRAPGDRNAGCEHPVQGGEQPVEIELIRGIGDAHDLAARVNAGIGPPCSCGGDVTAKQAGERRLDVSLDRANARLTCETMKRGPVVGEVQPEVQS